MVYRRLSLVNELKDSEIEKLLTLSVLDDDLIEDLAEKAFNNKGEKLWSELQFYLFRLNTKLMKDGFAVGFFAFREELEST